MELPTEQSLCVECGDWLVPSEASVWISLSPSWHWMHHRPFFLPDRKGCPMLLKTVAAPCAGLYLSADAPHSPCVGLVDSCSACPNYPTPSLLSDLLFPHLRRSIPSFQLLRQKQTKQSDLFCLPSSCWHVVLSVSSKVYLVFGHVSFTAQSPSHPDPQDTEASQDCSPHHPSSSLSPDQPDDPLEQIGSPPTHPCSP